MTSRSGPPIRVVHTPRRNPLVVTVVALIVAASCFLLGLLAVRWLAG